MSQEMELIAEYYDEQKRLFGSVNGSVFIEWVNNRKTIDEIKSELSVIFGEEWEIEYNQIGEEEYVKKHWEKGHIGMLLLSTYTNKK